MCDVNADCTDTEGSYTCACKPSYTGDGKTCGCKYMLHIIYIYKQLYTCKMYTISGVVCTIIH